MIGANLEEFAAKIGNICALELGGKLTVEDAYDHIKILYKELRRTHKSIRRTFPEEDSDLPNA